MPGSTDSFLYPPSELPFQRHEPGQGVTGSGGFTRIAIYRAMPLAEEFAQPFAVQFASCRYAGDLVDGAGVFAWVLVFSCVHHAVLFKLIKTAKD